MDDFQGVMLGQYRLEAVVGRGSTATVYKAYQQSLGRYVAVKLLHPNLDPHFDTRFEREAQAVAQLHHRNILPIYDYGEEAGQRYFVTQYVENGQNLADLFAGRPLAPLHALRLLADVLDALDYAHRRGVIHRDVKPSNILMPQPDWPLLADFGIAKLLDETSHLTPPGQMVGTAAYLAPERATGRTSDARADLYAAGVVLYELLTGQVPFTAPSPATVIMQHVHAPLPPARSLNPAVPPQVEALLARALEKDPDRRYQTAADMLADVRRTIGSVEREAARSELESLLERQVGGAPSRSYDTVELPATVPPLPSPVPDAAGAGSPQHAPQDVQHVGRIIVPLLMLVVGASLLAALLIPWSRARSQAQAGDQPPAATSARPPTPAPAAALPTLTPPEPSPVPTVVQATPEPSPAAPTLPPPEPSPPPSLTPTALRTATTEPPAAPPVALEADGLMRLEDADWAGGFGGAGNPRTYGGRSATWVYGLGTGYDTMGAVVTLPDQPRGTARLTVEGMDSEGRAKSEIRIAVNGVEIYRGPNPLPDDDIPLESGTWASFTWEFDAALLGPGRNEISIANLSPGMFSRPPFFALDYAVLAVDPAP